LGANDTSFTGPDVTSQPAAQRESLISATGLAAGSYMVMFRATVSSDMQAIECGVTQDDLNAAPVFVADGAPAPEKDPQTFAASGVLSVTGPAQRQILYCHSDEHVWDAASPEIDFIQIGTVTQGVSG
jgi:hypothetical protein